jgi:NAD(P)-dependent dehydrogenase (short-subunit alcohol dehydrogenase family)
VSAQLNGKTALVTGSTSGLGRAIAIALAQAGAHVVVSGRDKLRGDDTVAAIAATGGHATFVQADLSGGVDAARALAAQAVAISGGIDVLVNNAGIFPGGFMVDVSEELFDSMFAVNVKSTFFLTAAIAPAMLERGSGSIINLGSITSFRATPGSSVYAASKATLESFTKSWAAEFGARGVRVNAISPGLVQTEGTSAAYDRVEQMAAGGPALKRSGRPEELGPLAVYLASDDSAYVTGAIITIDGGFTL